MKGGGEEDHFDEGGDVGIEETITKDDGGEGEHDGHADNGVDDADEGGGGGCLLVLVLVGGGFLLLVQPSCFCFCVLTAIEILMMMMMVIDELVRDGGKGRVGRF